jgi:hypothetical protein
MKHPSIKKQLYRFLRQNPSWHAKGSLERMEWRKKDGTTATPDNIGRRLRELAQEGKLEVEQRKNHDWYAIPSTAAKPKTVTINITEDGASKWVEVPADKEEAAREHFRAKGILVA